MNILLQCPCALSPRLREPSVLIYGEWSGTRVVARRGLRSGELCDVILVNDPGQARSAFRRELELERREAEIWEFAEAPVITKGDGEALAKTVLAVDENERCLAVVAGDANYHVLAHRGRFFQYEIEDMGLDGDDLNMSPPPDRPGLYVFEANRVVGCGWNPRKKRRDEFILLGEWRPAVVADFDFFDLDARAITPPANMTGDTRRADALNEVFNTLVRVVYDNESGVFPVVSPTEPLTSAARQ